MRNFLAPALLRAPSEADKKSWRAQLPTDGYGCVPRPSALDINAAPDTLGALVSLVPSLLPDAPALAAHEAFSAAQTLYAIAVVDPSGRPVGVLNRFKFLESLSRPYGRDLLMRQPVSKAMDPAPLVVDEMSSIDDLGTVLSGEDSRYAFDGFIVTREGRYLGIGTAFGLVRHLTERRHAALYHMAHHDSLTGLANRELFDAQLARALADAERSGRRVSVFYLDLDRFKAVNDTFGHLVGDLLLQSVANRLRASVREGDTVARLSGDEYAIVLPNVGSDEDAEAIAIQLLEVLRRPHTLEHHEVDISGSMGIAMYPTDALNHGALMRAADTATYHAKRFRNTHQRYSSGIAQGYAVRSPSFGPVRRALEEGQLSVHYQPQIDARTGLIDGVEALVRWHDGEHGLQSTPELIRLAEDAGLISEVTSFVLAEAMGQVLSWERQGLARNLTLAVNVSSVEVREGLLVPMLEKHLAATHFPPTALELEITESTAMLHGAAARALLTGLTARGVRLSIDDFGTGYSSFSRLRRLPVHALKIDRSFVEDIGNESSAALARAIILMAHSLGLSVTAEGVETPEQWAFLRAHQCDRMQGYLLSRPLDAAGMVEYLRRQPAAHPVVA